MDTVYFSHPLLLLYAVLLLALHVLCYFLPKIALWLTVLNVILHGIFCFAVLVSGGTLYEFVLVLLLSCVVAMILGALEEKKKAAKTETEAAK